MNCKNIKDNECNNCKDKMICRTFLGLKPLSEYSGDYKKYKDIEWDNDVPVIVTAKRNPILGVTLESNIDLKGVPESINKNINNWLSTVKSNLKLGVDNKGITRTFMY